MGPFLTVDAASRGFDQTRVYRSGSRLGASGRWGCLLSPAARSMESSLFWMERVGLSPGSVTNRTKTLPRLLRGLEKEANVSWFHGGWPWKVRKRLLQSIPQPSRKCWIGPGGVLRMGTIFKGSQSRPPWEHVPSLAVPLGTHFLQGS